MDIKKINNKPSLIITIDTEGDNLWSTPNNITTNNAQYLYRFQKLCEKYGFKPTYLTNYEMANSSCFQELGKDILERKTGEIGMHLHAWNSPPYYQLTENDYRHQPYLIEYPVSIIKEKVKILTQLLEDKFQVKMLSHRAGRWAFNETYAEILVDNGYLVDCSVTPLCSWKNHKGDPKQNGGIDYSNFQNSPYYVDLMNISKSGDSSLLEVPMTIVKIERPWIIQESKKINSFERIANRFFPAISWLRPNGRNIRDMLNILNDVILKQKDYVMFMLHSSELMPGGSPTFKTKHSIEKLFSDMEQLFINATKDFNGCTISEFQINYSRPKFPDLVSITSTSAKTPCSNGAREKNVARVFEGSAKAPYNSGAMRK